MNLSKIVAVLFAMTLGASGTVHAELVRNGGFEANVISGSIAQLSAVDGWTSNVAGAAAFEIQKGALQGGSAGFNPYAYEGKQYLELNAATFTTVSQAIATSAPGLYSLSFAYAGRPDTANGAVSLMNVYWGANKLNSSPLVGQTNGAWSTFTINDLVAANASTMLRFESVGPASAPSYGSYLDGVSVKAAAVPEPGSIALLLLGVAGLAVSRRRKA